MKISRRGFLSLMGVATAAAALPFPEQLLTSPELLKAEALAGADAIGLEGLTREVLEAMVDSLHPRFRPRTSNRVVRLGELVTPESGLAIARGERGWHADFQAQAIMAIPESETIWTREQVRAAGVKMARTEIERHDLRRFAKPCSLKLDDLTEAFVQHENGIWMRGVYGKDMRVGMDTPSHVIRFDVIGA